MVSDAAIQADRFLDEDKSLACIHCGLCLSACPTYLETGNENDSPRGRIHLMRAIQDGRLSLNDTTVSHVDLCLGCRACEAACPSGVEYGDLLETTRNHVEQKHQRSFFQTVLRRFVIEKVFPYPFRMKLALIPAMILKGLALDQFLPKFAADSLALIPDDWHTGERKDLTDQKVAEPRKGRVGFINGCVMSVMFAKTNESTVELINAAGFEVVSPSGQGCCGALYAHSGQLERAREMARQNILAFEKEELDAIVINAAGCGSTLKEYAHLLKDDAEFGQRAKRFNNMVLDLTEFLVRNPIPQLNEFIPKPTIRKVTYHDACHLAHPQGITKQPRDLVKQVAGSSFVEMSESDVCCGSAGTYNLTEPEMAERLQKRKVANIQATEARTVVTSNPGCILQMRAGLKADFDKRTQVKHIADYLANALKADESKSSSSDGGDSIIP